MHLFFLIDVFRANMQPSLRSLPVYKLKHASTSYKHTPCPGNETMMNANLSYLEAFDTSPEEVVVNQLTCLLRQAAHRF